MKQNIENKSQVKFLLENIKDRKIGKRQKYMEKLNRYQVSTIFKARTRMLYVDKRPLGPTAPLSNNTLPMIHSPMNTQ